MGCINELEYNLLDNFIDNREPAQTYDYYYYWWKAGEKQPRLDWIDEQLKTLKQ